MNEHIAEQTAESSVREMPGSTRFDSTLALAMDPYRFISKRCRRYGSDLFQTRILLQPTICMMGREAAQIFYDPERLIRHGALPGRIQKTLFGRGVYGTNRDERTWQDPERFLPERFQQWGENAYDFIPQGGGDHYLNHRCPGEWITIELMKAAVIFLVAQVEYDLPEQDLRIDFFRLPALPQSRFVITEV